MEMMDYGAFLTDEQRIEIVNQRIVQLAAEAYQRNLNRDAAIAVGNEEEVAIADTALNQLRVTLNVHLMELQKIKTRAEGE